MTDVHAPRLPGIPPAAHAPPELLDLLHHGEARDLETLDARRTLLAAIESQHPVITNGGLPSWVELWRAGLQPALHVTAGDVAASAVIARAALRLAGELHGPDLRTAGVTVAVGDTLTAAQPTRLGELRLDAGVPMHVTDIDHARQTLTVDVPTLGAETRVAAGDAGFRSLTYGYAEPPSVERDVGRTVTERTVGLSW